MIYKGPFLLLLFSLLFFNAGTATLFGQSHFQLPSDQKRDRIDFQLLNNLVVIPVKVNNKELNFILDTGAKETLLFSLSDVDSLEIKNVTPIKIRGLGTGGTLDALKSTANKVEVGEAIDRNHTLYVIFDERINFSPRMGVPIHGVIGYEFYKDFVVKADYARESLTMYRPFDYKYRRCRKCESFKLVLRRQKPYLIPQVEHDGVSEEVVLLLDTGSSDALWLFEESWYITEEPKNYFEDFLGFGISGNIFGKRAKMDQFALGKFQFERVTVSFPEPEATSQIVTYDQRDGSLGGEILKRFTVIIDYRSEKMTLKRNRFYDEPFHYNMAGLVIEHDGAVTVNNFVEGRTSFSLDTNDDFATDKVEIQVSPILNFFLAPRYVVAEVRPGSPAALAGIQKGDEVVTINGKPSYKYKLFEITELFSSKADRRIYMEIERDGKIEKLKFTLKEVL